MAHIRYNPYEKRRLETEGFFTEIIKIKSKYSKTVSQEIVNHVLNCATSLSSCREQNSKYEITTPARLLKTIIY